MRSFNPKILLVLLFLASAFILLHFSLIKNDGKLASPVLSSSKSIGLNQWFPKEVLGADSGPKITSKAAIFIETKTGKVIYSKNIHEKLPIASLAKIMTVLVALEHHKLDDKLVVSERASNMEPDEMILLPGEKITVKELLYGIFMVSANDAAEVLAENSVGSRDDFIKLMNSKASQIGMNNTKFVNPTGLDEDNGSSYSSAYDLAILTRYIIHQYPFLAEISGTEHIFIPATSEHQDYDMYSGINLLTTYPGVVGFKTGFTPEAGYTLVTLARRDNREVVGVLLDSQYRRDEAKELLDYSFKGLN